MNNYKYLKPGIIDKHRKFNSPIQGNKFFDILGGTFRVYIRASTFMEYNTISF